MINSMSITLLGTVLADLHLNPAWYLGLDADEIADRIRSLLRSEWPGAEFDEEELRQLGRQIHEAATT